MWNCQNCSENIEDKYRHCWNCGKAKPLERTDTDAGTGHEVRNSGDAKPNTDKHTASIGLKLPKIDRPKRGGESNKSDLSDEGKERIESGKHDIDETEKQTEDANSGARVEDGVSSKYESAFLSDYQTSPVARRQGRFLEFVLVVGWCLVTIGCSYFAYRSFQKMETFSKNIELEKQNINSQKQQFVFPGRPTLKRRDVIETLPMRSKVLPLNIQDGEIEDLFSDLPDELRPTEINEVKTLMWFDCGNREVGRNPDGSKGLQEHCQIYLVDRETTKFIAIREFVGIMPSLAKESEGPDSVGKVMPEKYVRFLIENLGENATISGQSSADSPNHHFFSKSEFIYALLTVVILVAIGFGWCINKFRFSRTSK